MYIKPLMPTGLAANVKIMPEYFKDAGYNTHAIGKWHLGFSSIPGNPESAPLMAPMDCISSSVSAESHHVFES